MDEKLQETKSGDDQASYYEIDLTNRQVVGAFFVLLLCILGAFLSGVFLGRGAAGATGVALTPHKALQFRELLAIGVGLLAAASFLYYLLRRESKPPSIDQRLKELTESLGQAARAVGAIEKEMAERKDLAERLKADLEMYTSLINVRKPEVEAVAKVLRLEVTREGRKSLVTNLVISIIILVLGVLASRLFH